MSGITLEFTSTDLGLTRQDVQFFDACIKIDNHMEQVRCDACLWTKGDYEKHWELGQAKLNNSEMPVILCSSLGKLSADLWVVFEDNQHLSVVNLVVPRDSLDIIDLSLKSETIIKLLPELAEEDISRWTLQRPQS